MTATSARPAAVPAEVQTSDDRWAASPAMAGEPVRRATRRRRSATIELTAAEAAMTAIARSRYATSGAPDRRRRTASTATAAPAARTSTPSTAAARFSLFSCPYGWSASAGRAAARTPAKAMADATRSPAEFAASDRTATEPVTTPTTSLTAVSRAFDATDSRAAARFRRA